MSDTNQEYATILFACREVFLKKNEDYGTSWRLFRPSSLTDQIYIKAQRIRNIEESGRNAVGDNIRSEFMGIVNYSLIALIQLSYIQQQKDPMNADEISLVYEDWANKTQSLMRLKNSDYSEVWRDMRISSFTDMVLVKIARIKQIEDNQGKTKVSEGVEANYQDIVNYAIFALIRL
ncbi:MAG: hypothetical protein CK532_04020 [Flavobacteriales bacterium]|nr:MAG: hypothetical protein CK532_04020 [Flavobacteriales bacterium]